MRTQLPLALIAAVSATALLAACKDQNSGVLPPPTGAPIASMGLDQAAPPPPAYAPPAERLAPARPIRVSAIGPAPDRYLYVDDAYDMIDAFGDSPPDYAFDYDGVEPWVWRSDAGYYRVVEFVPGGLREYYYEPGYDEPFLIRDPRYSYGYDRGVLVTVYDSYGRALPRDLVVREADYAGRYYARAEQLHYAALHQQRRAAYARQWQARQDSLAEARQRWAIQRDRDNEWRQLRDRRGEVQRTAWAPEQRQRADYAARFAAEQKSQPPRGFMQAFRDNRERAREQQQAKAQADRAQQLAQQDRQRQAFDRGGGNPREEAQRRQAEAQAQRMNDDLRRQERGQALAQQQSNRQAEQVRGQERQAQRAQMEQQRAQAQQQRQGQAEQQRGQERQAQRAQMEQQRAQAEQQRGQERQAQRAQMEQQRAQAQQQRQGQAEQQRGQERQAQRAQMEQQRAQAQQQQRAQMDQQRAQAQQQRAEAANAQRQARDASAHERQAQAQPQKQHGNDKHDRPQ